MFVKDIPVRTQPTQIDSVLWLLVWTLSCLYILSLTETLAQQINGPWLVYCMVQAQGNSLCSLAQLPASSVYTFLIPRNRGEGYLRPYNGLYETALPERGTFFQASGIWKSRDFTCWSIWLSVKGPKRPNRWILYGLIKSGKLPIFVINSYLNDNAFTAVKRDAQF